MKRKLKLKDKEQQEAAAEFICHDSNTICSVFAKVVRPHPDPHMHINIHSNKFEKCSITYNIHQWILCSEWVPSE